MTYAADYYNAADRHRTDDHTRNVCAVGEAVRLTLAAYGITAIHDTTVHDSPVYSGAYTRSAAVAEKYLKEYPTIQVVLDVHRDAIVSGDTYYKTAAELDGQQTAQLMFVTGTDGGGLSHPNWRDNLAFQALLHHRMNSLYPGIMRPMSIRASRFNQHVRTGSMLVEVGACGNTLEEALAAAGVFAETLADVLLE